VAIAGKECSEMETAQEARWTDLLRGLVACQSSLLATLQTEIEELEEVLETVGDDAQLANVDLQSVLQKQQQSLQMLSQISQTLHDTAMAIIRKIGG
jgi:hypothetical protein